MRGDSSFAGDARSSALWGKGSNGESRRSALWGKGGRSAIASFAIVVAFMVPVAAASADGGSGSSGNSGPGSSGDKITAIVPGPLLKAAEASPARMFQVIVQGTEDRSSDDVASALSGSGKLKKKFLTLAGISASISGEDLLKLARHSHVLAITPDVVAKTETYENNEVWRDTTRVTQLYRGDSARTYPAIAVVDSGVSAKADFGERVVASVDVTGSGSTADVYGHGTLVAGLAAGASRSYPGAAPMSPIVSLKVSGADGRIVTSDLIAAADWILTNKDRYGIRVANYSTRSAGTTSFRYDPLDKAVERLVFSGVVVVAAAGNHGTGSKTNMSYAPGNDPFVITVGSTDTKGTMLAVDDSVPTWSAFGTTADGFGKPDIAAPGRYLIGPVPADSTLAQKGADRIMAPGYMWMSGTSLSTAIVSGIAAHLLAFHSNWSPGQVKGALMSTAIMPTSAASSGAAGNGEVNGAAAAYLLTAPDANAALMRFVSNGAFNTNAWAQAASSGGFSTDWYATDWYATDWYATDWYATDWYATDWYATDWYATDWYATGWYE